MPRTDDRAEYWAVLKRPLIRSSRAARAKPVGRIAGSGENPIARLFDHATNPAAVMGTAPTVTLPDGTNATPDIAGATAEWIVERPAIPGHPSGQPPVYNFPDYGHTEFDLCVAVEGDGVDIFSLFGGLPQQLEGARRIRMFDVLFNPARTAFISMPRKLDDTTVLVRYGGF